MRSRYARACQHLGRIAPTARAVRPLRKIDGLYAAGVCTSGWDGEVYGGGTCQTVGMWAGSRAARHAVVNKLGGTVADDWMGTERSQDPSEAQGPQGGDSAQGGEAALGDL
ncbi:MAG: hypothetical protein ACLSVD_08930 [Eggerthellaceae bacterium]